MKIILWVLRIIVGVLFIFSGLIKANDPSGLSYKMNEFFEVWGTHQLMDYSLILSVAMIAFEIIAGVGLLIGAFFRSFSFWLLLLTLFFTFLTAYVYLTDKIKECGCFGDCIKISNAETFWKDVILLLFVIILFLFRKRVPPLFPKRLTLIIMTLTVILAFGVQFYTLRNLPVFDCLPFKVGNNLIEKTQAPPGSVPDEFKTVLIYQKDGKQQEFTESNFPWQDTTWTFVDSKTILVKKGNADPEIKDFVLTDYEGNLHTDEVIRSEQPTYLLFLRDISKADTKDIRKIQKLIQEAKAKGYPFYVLSSVAKNSSQAFAAQYQLQNAQWLQLDATASKTAMRSNPGLMIIHKGIIKAKYSSRNYPSQIDY